MAHHDMTDGLEGRLRAARPQRARVDEDAFDAELLARVREQPIAARRSVPRAVALPVAAGVTLTATAAIMLGGPGKVGGPSSAGAITQALHWLSPPSGTILHTRSVEISGGRTTTREFWQSADHPDAQRQVVGGASSFEISRDGLYDAARNTIYDAPKPLSGGKVAADKAKRAVRKPAPAGAAKNGTPEAIPIGDPIVGKVRMLLRERRLVVKGLETHNGTKAWAISLRPGAGRPAWTLWVSAADGKPLELRDPGRDANEAPQVIRWPTYEVLPASRATALLTLTGAHPSARVVHDPDQAAAAQSRLLPGKW